MYFYAFQYIIKCICYSKQTFLKKILLDYSFFTMLCYFLLYRKVNQPYAYIYPSIFGFPSHLGHHRALT